MATFVLTLLGDDRPGLVSAISAPISAHGASWERSQLSRLEGKFAGIVLVAFGNPAQEAWILDNSAACTAPLMFGVGALLDFLSGNARRAPRLVRTLHLEWLFRLAHEPRRLLKRYTWDLARFFRICLLAGRRP